MQLRLAVSKTLIAAAPRRTCQPALKVQCNTLWQLQPGEWRCRAQAASALPGGGGSSGAAQIVRALPRSTCPTKPLCPLQPPLRCQLVQEEPAVVQGAVPGAPAPGRVCGGRMLKQRRRHVAPLQVDLTGNIGRKRVCSIASGDFQSSEVIDMCVLDHGGVHLIFEAEGSANPLDSPSILFVTVRRQTLPLELTG